MDAAGPAAIGTVKTAFTLYRVLTSGTCSVTNAIAAVVKKYIPTNYYYKFNNILQRILKLITIYTSSTNIYV